ncbi:hypothetical protein JXA59_00205 [Patescibacteria group bacterium]|nr:hypothetical protein [Patescibacteria group bacterium]
MGSPVFIFATTAMVAVILTAALISQYQRETTSIEDKYTNRSAAEIDSTYHQSYLDDNLIIEDGFYDDNIIKDSEVYGSGIATQASSNPSDFDEDGIPNATDSDPRNPDSDGDGLIDGRDPNPTDPTLGKTETPPLPPQPGPVVQSGELKIGTFYTNVRNLSRGATRWATHTESKPGDQLAFIIHAELTNTSSMTAYEAKIFDRLESKYLKPGGTATVEINGGLSQTLPSTSWMSGYTITVPAGQTKIVEIRFNATAELRTTNQIVVATNYAWALDVISKNKKSDIAFVTINSY